MSAVAAFSRHGDVEERHGRSRPRIISRREDSKPEIQDDIHSESSDWIRDVQLERDRLASDSSIDLELGLGDQPPRRPKREKRPRRRAERDDDEGPSSLLLIVGLAALTGLIFLIVYFVLARFRPGANRGLEVPREVKTTPKDVPNPVSEGLSAPEPKPDSPVEKAPADTDTPEVEDTETQDVSLLGKCTGFVTGVFGKCKDLAFGASVSSESETDDSNGGFGQKCKDFAKKYWYYIAPVVGVGAYLWRRSAPPKENPATASAGKSVPETVKRFGRLAVLGGLFGAYKLYKHHKEESQGEDETDAQPSEGGQNDTKDSQNDPASEPEADDEAVSEEESSEAQVVKPVETKALSDASEVSFGTKAGAAALGLATIGGVGQLGLAGVALPVVHCARWRSRKSGVRWSGWEDKKLSVYRGVGKDHDLYIPATIGREKTKHFHFDRPGNFTATAHIPEGTEVQVLCRKERVTWKRAVNGHILFKPKKMTVVWNNRYKVRKGHSGVVVAGTIVQLVKKEKVRGFFSKKKLDEKWVVRDVNGEEEFPMRISQLEHMGVRGESGDGEALGNVLISNLKFDKGKTKDDVMKYGVLYKSMNP